MKPLHAPFSICRPAGFLRKGGVKQGGKTCGGINIYVFIQKKAVMIENNYKNALLGLKSALFLRKNLRMITSNLLIVGIILLVLVE